MLNNLLDHVVTVSIFNASDDVRFNFLYDFVSEVRREGFQGFLNNSTAILVT